MIVNMNIIYKLQFIKKNFFYINMSIYIKKISKVRNLSAISKTYIKELQNLYQKHVFCNQCTFTKRKVNQKKKI